MLIISFGAGMGFIPVRCDSRQPSHTTALLDGDWQLRWDDTVDASLDGGVKSCSIRLQAVDGRLQGAFVGPVAGRERNAILEGQLINHGTGSLLQFYQRESGYVCSYQLCWPQGEPITDAVGVWHDTQGRYGSFALLKYQ
ncbi:MAG: hypothetical protein KDA61_17675 [Planctomycetales bacterium]|nr:hypothetical protein [Planctomycetales bacterium]